MPSLPPNITRLADRRPGRLVRAWRWISKRIGIAVVVVAVAVAALAAAIWINPGLVGTASSPPTTPPTLPPVSSPQTVPAGSIQVIDGDTIRHKGVTVRLVGFNAPETGQRAACEAERTLGYQATRRLSELVRTGTLEFNFVACSCPPGTEGTQQCNFGRRCGTLKVNGRNVGAILIAERLAVPFRCGATRCPATPRPWC